MGAPITPSQTVGPFFGVGLPYDRGEQLVEQGTPGAIRIEGQVLDANGDPVKDALVETWQADERGCYDKGRFGRCRTDSEGAFHFVTVKPGVVKTPDGMGQAPHLNVTVFARGLLRHLVTRMYFPDEASANAKDPILNRVDAARRSTLIGKAGGQVLRFDIRLQGDNETVFFAI
jgi:protocatechuate 3,4-dioxygenase, alpha subunit